MKVLVVNSGSSSIKYQLFDMTDESVLAKGLVERIGISDSIINHYPSGIFFFNDTATTEIYTLSLQGTGYNPSGYS